jgi:hypothetical protein
MRRGSDRIEGWLTAAMLLVFLAATPVAAIWASRAMYHSDLRHRQTSRAHVVRVESVLLENPGRPYTKDGDLPADYLIARARWTGPDGRPREGEIQVGAGDRAGQLTAIWTDDHGNPATPPTQPNPQGDAVAASVVAVLCMAALLGTLSFGVRALLNRHRLRGWQQEWFQVGPHWTRHR